MNLRPKQGGASRFAKNLFSHILAHRKNELNQGTEEGGKRSANIESSTWSNQKRSPDDLTIARSYRSVGRRYCALLIVVLDHSTNGGL